MEEGGGSTSLSVPPCFRGVLMLYSNRAILGPALNPRAAHLLPYRIPAGLHPQVNQNKATSQASWTQFSIASGNVKLEPFLCSKQILKGEELSQVGKQLASLYSGTL